MTDIAWCCKLDCDRAATKRITWETQGRMGDCLGDVDACEEHVEWLMPETGECFIEDIDVSAVDLLGFLGRT